MALNLAVKAGLVLLLAIAVAFPDIEQFEGKAMAWRAATYPLAALIVPLWWLWRRPARYPVAVDILLVLPFLIDTLGNALDLYDTVGWWDDANHFVNWAILTAAAALVLRRQPMEKVYAVGLAIGFGAVTAIGWEIMEYFAFIRDSPELETAYTDTLGDLALGTAGSILAAIAIAYTGRRG